MIEIVPPLVDIVPVVIALFKNSISNELATPPSLSNIADAPVATIDVLAVDGTKFKSGVLMVKDPPLATVMVEPVKAI